MTKTKNELLELHHLLKSHPFRENNDVKYLKSYMNLFYRFLKACWEGYNYKDLAKDPYRNALSNMYHDMSRTLSYLKNTNEYNDSVRIQYLEMCLQLYHHWLEFDEVPEFYILSHENKETKIYKHIWNSTEKRYFTYFPSKEEYLTTINDVKKKWAGWDDSEDITDVTTEICDDLQYTYDHYDELFGVINNDTKVMGN